MDISGFRLRRLRPLRLALLVVGAALLAVAGCSSSAPSAGSHPAKSAAATPAPTGTVAQPAHTVIVMFENRGYSQVIGSSQAPYFNELAHQGALFTNSHAITHPSQPNYLALFSGSTHGVESDSCPYTFNAPNLASGLIAAGKTFIGYAEDLPAVGSPQCISGEYERKHVPWADFSNIPASVSQPFTSFPVGDYSALPTVSWVTPNMCNDMHDCSIKTGDTWLQANLSGYVNWAMTHDSLLIVTFDEDEGTQVNQIPTIFVGQQVRPGKYAEHINDYNVLATIEAAYGLPRDGSAAKVSPITDVWRQS
jgi:phosphatidylinositol-3-phosphatase